MNNKLLGVKDSALPGAINAAGRGEGRNSTLVDLSRQMDTRDWQSSGSGGASFGGVTLMAKEQCISQRVICPGFAFVS